MKDNKNGWQFPKALEIIKCKEGNKEFMKERPARRSERFFFLLRCCKRSYSILKL